MVEKFYKDLDKQKKDIIKFLNNFSKSKILQDHLFQEFKSLLYGNLINIFFKNLNKENVDELDLQKGKIGKIKKKYRTIIKETNLALHMKPNKIDENYFQDFKRKVKKDFPGHFKMIIEMENKINIKKLRKYLNDSEKEIRKAGKTDKALHDIFFTNVLEIYIQKEKSIPVGTNLEKIIKSVTKKSLPVFTEKVMKNLKKDSKSMLNYQRKYQKEFEKRLYQSWKLPIDLFECLIEISGESGIYQSDKLTEITNKTNNFKHGAILKIHARAVQIAKEILTLIKSGYADGGNARWRSIYELSLICFYLSQSTNEVSERYLKHEIVDKLKRVESYMKHHKKLGYPPMKRDLNKLKKMEKQLCLKFGNYFKSDYGWIPISHWPVGSTGIGLSFLEKKVKISHLNPYYKLSCASMHGGSDGFFRMGLMDGWQNKLLLIGPSNYGHADPIQNTVISLSQITLCLLNLQPDFVGLIQMQVIMQFVNEIKVEAVKAQRQIEKDEANNVVIMNEDYEMDDFGIKYKGEYIFTLKDFKN